MKLYKSFKSVGFGILLSRISGYIRDMVSAFVLGANVWTDAFYLSFMIPNFFRRLLAEGALSVSIIPLYTDELAHKDFETANKNISVLITFFITLAFIFTVLGIIFAPQILHIIAPGFKDKGIHSLAVLLLRIMFPFLIFITASSMIMGVLNTLKTFFIPSVSTALFNITMIIFIYFIANNLKYDIETKVVIVSIGVFFGAFLQVLFQIPVLFKKNFKFSFNFNFKSDIFNKGILLFIPAIYGMAIIQINLIVDNIIASYLDKGSISYLYYSNRLIQFPLAMFGICIGIVLLPYASEYIAKKDFIQLNKTIRKSIIVMLLFILPSVAGFLMIGRNIISVLFEHGRFSANDTVKTYAALSFYSLGLISYAGIKIFASIYYSFKDTKSPVKFATISLLTNIILNITIVILWTLYFPYKEYRFVGLCFSTVISSSINFFLLIKNINKKMENNIKLSFILSDILKIFFSCIFMILVLYFVKDLIDFNKYVDLLILILSAALSYFSLLKILKFNF